MAQNRNVAVIGALPIPVGHEVRSTWFEAREESMSFLGREKVSRKPLPTPRIEDLTTGIAYGHMAHYTDSGSIRSGTINVEQARVRSDLQTREVLQGVVKSCDVVVVSFDDAGREVHHIETHLVVEVR